MKKIDKKIDIAICQNLTQLCEEKLKQERGFQWLTHSVNYKQFPRSLKVICVFDREATLANIKQKELRLAVQNQLLQIDINIAPHQVSFDSEEQCERQHSGNWQKRLK